jgi:hypothetical protein
LRNVPLSDIDAGFFMVSTGELIRPDAMPDLAELARGLGRGKVPHLGIPSSI